MALCRFFVSVDEHLIPKTETDARRAFYLVGMSQSIAGSDAETLGRALHEVPLHIASSPMEKNDRKALDEYSRGHLRAFFG